jgi:hypothetical protein
MMANYLSDFDFCPYPNGCEHPNIPCCRACIAKWLNEKAEN